MKPRYQDVVRIICEMKDVYLVEESSSVVTFADKNEEFTLQCSQVISEWNAIKFKGGNQ